MRDLGHSLLLCFKPELAVNKPCTNRAFDATGEFFQALFCKVYRFGVVQFLHEAVPSFGAHHIERRPVVRQHTKRFVTGKRYFAHNGLGQGNPAAKLGLDDLYLTVLTPAARSEQRRHAALDIAGPQASYLHVDRDRQKPITRDSIVQGLYAYTNQLLQSANAARKSNQQYAQNDSWDWDEVTPPLLIDTEINGKKTPAAVRAGRNGYMWVLERTNSGALKYVNAWPYVGNNVFKALDPKTGRPEYDMSKKPSMAQGAAFCPSLWGGKDWLPEAYNPKTGLVYTMANENMCSELPKGESTTYKAGDLFIGFPLEGVLTNVRLTEGAKDHIGEIQAWDPATGKKVWTQTFKDQIWTPTFTTAGNLVFAGGTPDRKWRAFDAKTGKQLWEYNAASGVIGVPSSYEVDGEQYIAVQAGWGIDAQRMQSGIDALEGKVTTVPQGGTIMVFKLEK